MYDDFSGKHDPQVRGKITRFDCWNWGHFDYDTARQALTAEGLSGGPLGQRLAELFLASQQPDAAASAPDPIDEARARRALDIAHSGAWPGPQPRSPATGRPIPPPPGHAGRPPTRKPHQEKPQCNP